MLSKIPPGKIRNSLVSAAIILLLSGALVLYCNVNNKNDTLGPGFAIVLYLLFAMTGALILGALFLLIDLLKIKRARTNPVFNFISVLNILIGITGIIFLISSGFEKPSYVIPFLCCILVGLTMFYRIDK